jgi:eukaryotic-like serine/threonine-protein kinase
MISPGACFGPYEVLSPIGEGGMGEVYRARDPRLNRIVALKVCKEGFSELFEREARIIASLDHPHICRLYDVGPNYLVMEFLEGTPLQLPLPLEKALQYSQQILDALDAAHRRGIIHRDLKPANILVTSQGIKLLDFGVAKLKPSPLPDGDAVTRDIAQEARIVGTFQYMSPEQIQGKDVDARSDLFSFGSLFYEMLTGKQAFGGGDAASVIAAILEREPPPFAVHSSLERVIRRALAKDPDDRFQTARDLKVALSWAAEQPISQLSEKRAKRRWLPLGVAGAAVLGVLLWTALRLSPGPQPAGAASRFTVEPPAGVVFNYRITGDAISPDGRLLVFRAASTNGTPLLWLRPIDSLTSRPLAGTDGGDYPFWSPDSQSLAYFASGKLEKLEINGGLPVTLCDADAANAVAGGSWNSDDTIIFGDRKGLQMVSGRGGAPTLLMAAVPSKDEGPYGYPQFLPDGKHFLYFAQSRDPANEGVYLGSLGHSERGIQVVATPTKGIYTAPFSGYPGFLLFLRGGSLMAQRFDATALRLEGEPGLIAPNISVLPPIRAAAFWASNSGTLVYRSGLGGLDQLKLTWRSRDGKEARQVAPPDAYTSLQLSPDGKQVVIGRRDITNFIDLSDLFILDLDRGATTRLTFGPEWNACPVWSPDGSHIAFVSSRAGGLQIYRKAIGSGAEEQLSTNNTEYKCPLDWSRDGRYLIYGESKRGVFDIWALPMTGQEKPILVLRPPFDKADAQLSPDGHWLAYASDESGRYEVYVQAFPVSDSGATQRWQASIEGGRAPRWRSDGQELFYVNEDDAIEAVEFQAQANGVHVGKPHTLFSTSLPADFGENPYPYDVAPDGQHFLVEEVSDPEQSSPLIVEVNWQAGFRKAGY